MTRAAYKAFLWTPVKNSIEFNKSVKEVSELIGEVAEGEVMPNEETREIPEWRTLKIAPGIEIGFWVPPSFLGIEERIVAMKDCESRTELIETHWERMSVFLNEAAKNKDFISAEEMKGDAANWFINKKGDE